MKRRKWRSIWSKFVFVLFLVFNALSFYYHTIIISKSYLIISSSYHSHYHILSISFSYLYHIIFLSISYPYHINIISISYHGFYYYGFFIFVLFGCYCYVWCLCLVVIVMFGVCVINITNVWVVLVGECCFRVISCF